jgi:hypothetical protein
VVVVDSLSDEALTEVVVKVVDQTDGVRAASRSAQR